MTLKHVHRKKPPKKQRSNKRQPSKLVKTLKRLSKLPVAQQQRQLRLANHKFIKDLCSATQKVRYAKFNVAPTLRKKLNRHRHHLRTLVSRRTSLQKKRQLLTQRGGIVPALIPILVAALGATGSIGAAATHAAISRA